MRIETHYLIVGAGPVGMTAAKLLTNSGRNCLVVERRDGAQRHPAAHVVNARTLEIFRQAGFDMAAIDALAENPIDAGHVNFVTDLSGELIGRLLFLQANIVSIDTTPSGAPDLTIVEVADPRLLEESIRASEILFGPSEVRLATTVLEGVDIVVTLGTPYLEREADNDDGAAGLVPDDTVPAGTVDADG